LWYITSFTIAILAKKINDHGRKKQMKRVLYRFEGVTCGVELGWMRVRMYHEEHERHEEESSMSYQIG
jgi:hypothetical protein